MFEDTIRNLSILFSATYSFYKLLNISPKSKNIRLTLVAVSTITSLISAFFFGRMLSLNWIFLLLTFLLSTFFLAKLHFSITYTTVLFSYALSFITFSFSALITTLLVSLFYYEKYNIPWLIIRIFTGIIHMILIYCCFRIPRLKRGMKFLYHLPSNNIGATICIVLIMLVIMFCQSKRSIEFYTLKCTSITLISAFFLLYWWNLPYNPDLQEIYKE